MTRRTFISTGFAAVIAAAIAPVMDAQAQYYGDRRDEVYCAGDDGRLGRCRMPWRDSDLSQQLSRASCIEGRTWGREPYGVWVSGGCRANFVEAGRRFGGGWRDDRYGGSSGGNGWGWNDRDGWSWSGGRDYGDRRRGPGRGQGPGREIYCASNDSRGSRCSVPWRYSELSRQMSKSTCVENVTWGSDPYSVWVKQGCRAQFVERW